MENLTMFNQFITFFLVLVSIASMHSLPLNNKAKRAPLSTTDPSPAITIPQSVLNLLANVENDITSSNGLVVLSLNARYLSDDKRFNFEVIIYS